MIKKGEIRTTKYVYYRLFIEENFIIEHSLISLVFNFKQNFELIHEFKLFRK